MIGKVALALAAPIAAVAVQEVPPNDPVDVAWATVIAVVITRVLEWWLERRRSRRDRYRR